MNKKYMFVPMLLLGTGLGAQIPAPVPVPDPAPVPAPVPLPMPMPGGFGALPPDSRFAREAARNVQALLDGRRLWITRVESAATQVVAGLNTRIDCQVRERNPDGTRETWRWRFVVFSPLEGRPRLQAATRLAKVEP